MAEQWQIRRGTTAENDAFTGAIGELTMDTDTKGVRIHDGSTQGGFQIDTVVAFQKPTAENNYTWARKYASGWVEQGGQETKTLSSLGSGSTATFATVTFPVAITNIIEMSFADNLTFYNVHARDESGTGMTIKVSNQLPVSGPAETKTVWWKVSGMAA